MRKVSPSGRRPGAGMAAKWTTASADGERVLGLAEIGQVGHQGLLGRVAVRADVDVDHVMAMLAQVAHDPRSALAAAARDDDPHVRHLRPQVSPAGQAGGWRRGLRA